MVGGILHLSINNNSIVKKIPLIYKAIQNYTLDVDEIFIAVTGDLAYSGKALEYVEALDFFVSIRDDLEKYSNKKINIILVPGNHDCNFDIKTPFRDLFIKDVFQQDLNNDLSFSEEQIEECCKIQQDYFSFMQCFNDPMNK